MKERKKDKNIRRAGIVTALVVVTLSLVGGTLAKYTSEGGGSAEARVAKFEVSGGELSQGFNVDALFDNWDDAVVVNPSSGVVTEPSNETDVWSGNTDENVIAPGTSGKFTIDVVNDSEVSVDYEVSLSLPTDMTGLASLPIEFSTVSFNQSSNEWEASAWSSTLSNATISGTLTAAGSGDVKDTRTIYWRWLYERGTGDTLDTNDAQDTTWATPATEGGFDTAKYELVATAKFVQVD